MVTWGTPNETSNGHHTSRVMLYSHDTYGLGHLRRSLLLAGRLSGMPEIGSILLTTGSPNAQSFELPASCDTVKLPSLTKNGAGTYETRTLGLTLDRTVSIRSEILAGTVARYQPSLFVADHSPVGAEGELWPLLERIRRDRDRPIMVLGLREIIDEAARVDEQWTRSGAWTAIEEIYDLILVYGDPSILTTAEELGLLARFPEKVRFTGYLTSTPRKLPPRSTPTIVVTVGGGGDGHPVLEAYAEFLESPANPGGYRSVIVTGPYMAPTKRSALEARLAPFDVEFHHMVEDLPALIHSATGVIAMAGYNTVAELLTSPARVLLAPRCHPRLEQKLRAERLAGLTGMEVLGADCPPQQITSFIRRCLEEPTARSVPRLRLDGLEEVATQIRTLLTDRRNSHVVTA